MRWRSSCPPPSPWIAHHQEELQRALRGAGLTPVGAPTWARFDPPFVPWFLRRNEVLQKAAEAVAPASGDSQEVGQ